MWRLAAALLLLLEIQSSAVVAPNSILVSAPAKGKVAGPAAAATAAIAVPAAAHSGTAPRSSATDAAGDAPLITSLPSGTAARVPQVPEESQVASFHSASTARQQPESDVMEKVNEMGRDLCKQRPDHPRCQMFTTTQPASVAAQPTTTPPSAVSTTPPMGTTGLQATVTTTTAATTLAVTEPPITTTATPASDNVPLSDWGRSHATPELPVEDEKWKSLIPWGINSATAGDAGFIAK